MIVKFNSHFLPHTSQTREIDVTGETVGDCLENLFNKFPQLLVHLVSDEYAECDKTSIALNGTLLSKFSELSIAVSDGDVIEFDRVPEGSGGVGKIIAGVVIVLGSMAIDIATGGSFSAALHGYNYMLGASLILGGLGEIIMGSPVLQAQDGAGTYSWSGIKNTTAPGTPIPIVYGQHRVGGHVIDAYVDAQGDEQLLWVQLAVSEGEIEDIDESTIEINSVNANHYEDVAGWWRKGTKENLPSTEKEYLLTPKESSRHVDLVRHGDRTELFVEDEPGFVYYNIDSTIQDSTGILLYTWGESLSKFDVYVWVDSPQGQLLATVMGGDKYTLKNVRKDYVRFTDTNGNTVSVPQGSKIVVGLYMYLTQIAVISEIDGKPELSEYKHTSGSLLILGYDYLDSSLDTRDSQASMYGFGRIENTYSYQIPITNQLPDDETKGGAIVDTQGPVDLVNVHIAAPMLYHNNEVTTVEFRIFYRKKGDIAWVRADTAIQAAGIKIKDDWNILKSEPTKSEQVITREIPFCVLPGFDVNSKPVYQIRVLRITPSHEGDIQYGDSLYLKGVNEVVLDDLAYPWTALVGYRIKANLQISGGLPTITQVVRGRKVRVPSNYHTEFDTATKRYVRYTSGPYNNAPYADWQEKWTDNPVWCLLDFLTNKRYGLGRYLRISPEREGLMIANFMVMAQYCDQYLTDTGVASTWNDANARPRFSLNIVLDQTRSASEWINIICSAMRAIVFYSEGLLWLEIDRKKNISQVFNMSNIKDFSQASGSYRSIINSLDVQFTNKELDYEQDSFILEANAVREDPSTEIHNKSMGLQGVTDYKQALSLATSALQRGEYCTTVCTFKTGTEGLQSTVYDVIGVQHDVPQWGYGGKVVSYNPSTKTITLSAPIGYIAGHTYEINLSSEGKEPIALALVNYSQWDNSTSYTVGSIVARLGNTYRCINNNQNVDPTSEAGASSWAKENLATLVNTPASAPKAGDTYSAGETSNSIKPFQIVSIKRDTDEMCEITCLEYNEQIYTNADNVKDFGEITGRVYSTLDTTLPTLVDNTKAEEQTQVALDGTIKTVIAVSYTPPLGKVNWKGAVVYYRIVGTPNWTVCPVNPTDKVIITGVAEGYEYEIAVASVRTDGSQQTVDDVYNFPGCFTTVTVSGKLSPPANVAGFVATVSKNGIVFSWTKVPDRDLSHYIIKEGEDWTSGTTINDHVTGTSFGYAPQDVGQLKYWIKAVDTCGNQSVTAAEAQTIYSVPNVTGLQLDGSGNADTWAGRDFPIKWNYVAPNGSNPLGGLSVTANSWFRYYVVEVWSNGVLRRTESNLVQERYVYTYDLNCKDGNGIPTRSLTFKVWVMAPGGTLSENPGVLMVSNPQIPKLSALALTGAVSLLSVGLPRPSDIDFVGYKVHASKTAGFTPNGSNQINKDGPESVVTVNGLAPGIWYVKAAGYDAFGVDSLNWSDEASVEVRTLDIVPELLDSVQRVDFFVRDVIFYFDGDTLNWDAGYVDRGGMTYTLSAGTMSDASSSFIMATFNDSTSTVTLSKSLAGNGVPIVNGNQAIIAVTSDFTTPRGDYLCAVRQSNSVSIDWAMIRHVTITDADITGTLSANKIQSLNGSTQISGQGINLINLGETATVNSDGTLKGSSGAVVDNSKIQVGGKNLIQGTGDGRGWWVYGSATTHGYVPNVGNISYGGPGNVAPGVMPTSMLPADAPNSVYFYNPAGGGSGYYYSPTFSLTGGKTYTISFWAYSFYIGTATFCIDNRDDFNWAWGVTAQAGNGGGNSGSWRRFEYTFTVNSFSGTKTNCEFAASTDNNHSIYLCGLKLEEGNKATAWSPAPEDHTAYTTTTVANVKVGGRNLFRDPITSVYSTYNTTCNHVGVTKVPDAPTMRITSATAIDDAYVFAGTIAMEAGRQYSISFWARASAATQVRDYSGWFQSNDYADRCGSPLGGAIDNTWRYVEETVTCPATKSYHLVLRGANTISEWIEYSGLKVEEGNKATAWTPAVEDVNAGIAEAATTATWDSSKITGLPDLVKNAGYAKPQSGSGFELRSDAMGYYSNGQWKTYMDKDGKFGLAGNDPNHSLTWDGAALNIKGNINAGSIDATKVTISGASLVIPDVVPLDDITRTVVGASDQVWYTYPIPVGAAQVNKPIYFSFYCNGDQYARDGRVNISISPNPAKLFYIPSLNFANVGLGCTFSLSNAYKPTSIGTHNLVISINSATGAVFSSATLMVQLSQ